LVLRDQEKRPQRRGGVQAPPAREASGARGVAHVQRPSRGSSLCVVNFRCTNSQNAMKIILPQGSCLSLLFVSDIGSVITTDGNLRFLGTAGFDPSIGTVD
jgi:hypothetical protein